MSAVPDPTPSNVAPRGSDPSAAVWAKLAFFSVALFAAPMAAYYGAKDRVFAGNATYAGGLAAAVANIVLIGYVIVAFLEDDGQPKKPVPGAKSPDGDEDKKESRKDR